MSKRKKERMGQLVLNSIFILVTIIYIVPFAMVISVSLILMKIIL